MVTPIQTTGTTVLAVPVETAEFSEDPSWDRKDVADELLEDTAQHFVHWLQAAAQLYQHFPYDTEAALRLRFAKKLIEIHGLDPRVEQVFDPEMRLLFTTGGWVDADTRQPQKHIRRTIERLAAMQDLVQGKSEWTLKPNACRIERTKSGFAPPGYEPIRVVRGISLRPDPRHIEIPVRHSGAQVALLNGDCLPRDEAYGKLGHDFPGLDQQYVDAVLAAAICADDAADLPPIVFIEAPTGSSHYIGLQFLASILADQVRDIIPTRNLDAVWRCLSRYCDRGHRFIHVPEIAKETDRMNFLLMLANVFPSLPQGQNPDRQTLNTAAYFVSGATVPLAYRRSTELRGRIRVVSLARSGLVDWQERLAERYGRKVSTTEWRSLSDNNALIANSILTHIYARCQQHLFRFTAVADDLGLPAVEEDDAEFQWRMCRELYRFCRGETPGRRNCDEPRYEGHQWVDTMTGPCLQILAQLADETEDVWKLKGRTAVLKRLRKVEWPKILDIDNPPVKFEFDCRCRAIRFCDASKRKKGTGVFNEDLPPIGGGESR